MNEKVNYSGFVDLINRHDLCERSLENGMTPLMQTELKTHRDGNGPTIEKAIETTSE